MPVWNGGDGPDFLFLDGIAACGCLEQEKDFLLNIRSQKGEVHDLGDPGAGHVPESGQVGEIAHLAPVDHVLEAHGQGQQSRDPRNPPR